MAEINYCLDKYGHLFPGHNERNLVHADFDPANILIDQIDGKWQVVAILDWEFAFSGSMLCDVANMLRYAHKMPKEYQESFLLGLKKNNIDLPEQWKIIIHLLNIVSLLDCLVRSDPENRPNQAADILSLIENIVQKLKKEK